MKDISYKYNIILSGGISEKKNSSNYCTLITIKNGEILNCHRKIKPTYEERLIWSDGDKYGLKTYELYNETEMQDNETLRSFKFGGLNCYENWIPHTRAALHAQNEVLHVAVWPGSYKLTKYITKFMALEGRSYIISISGLLTGNDFDHLTDDQLPFKPKLKSKKFWQNGGSMIMDPKGNIISNNGKPLINGEGIIYGDINPYICIQERQNFDYSGHYSRKDIFKSDTYDV